MAAVSCSTRRGKRVGGWARTTTSWCWPSRCTARSMPEFHLHERLLADCHAIGRMHHCHLLLHKNAVLPWFILVPETDVADLLDLPDDQLHAVTGEAAA